MNGGMGSACICEGSVMECDKDLSWLRQGAEMVGKRG